MQQDGSTDPRERWHGRLRARVRHDVRSLDPGYFAVVMATGIVSVTALTGARLLALPTRPPLAAMTPAIIGLSVVFWAFGTSLWPLLVTETARRVPRRKAIGSLYRPTIWSMVFPLGMYSASSLELGVVAHAPWIHAIGLAEGWLALVVWGVVFLAMVDSCRGRTVEAWLPHGKVES